MITARAKKLFNGKVSVRDYTVQKAIDEGGLEIRFANERMTLNPLQLMVRGRSDGKEYRSKWNDQTYLLIDYKWKPDQQRLL